MRNFKRFVLLCLPFMMTACSLFSVQTGPVNTYIIDKVPTDIPLRAKHRTILGITTPTSNPVFNTTDMVYQTYPHQIASFAKNSWVATPSQMLEPLLVKTMQNTHYFAAVKTTVMGRSDYILNTEILELIHDFKQNPSVVRVRIHADIVNSNTNQLIKSKEFKGVAVAPQGTPYGGVVAANRAVADVLSQIAWFCVR